MGLHTKIFRGVYSALITPFKNGLIDFNSLKKLINHQIDSGINGLVLLGTTGESATLSDKERAEVLNFTIETINGRIPFLIGTGSNCTQKTIELTQQADNLGAHGMLIVAPYYNRPNQEGLFLHYSKIAESTTKPICLYSIPSRCGIEIGVDTILKLRQKHNNIVGIKEAGGSCNRISDIIKNLDKDFCVLSGDDSLTLPFLALGACGVVSVASNWLGKPLIEMFEKASQNDLESAANINRRYYPLFRALSIETNPVPIKYLLYRAGLIESPEVRLPLSPLQKTSIEHLDNVFQKIYASD